MYVNTIKTSGCPGSMSANCPGLSCDIPKTTQERGIAMSLINRVVAKYFEISIENLEGESRKLEYVIPRHIAVFFIKLYNPKITLMRIARQFNKKDHAAIINSFKKVDDFMCTDKIFIRQMAALKYKIELESNLEGCPRN